MVRFFANWLDTMNIMILIDKVHHRFGLRSRSAKAKSGGLAQFVIRGFELAYLPLQFFRPLRLIGRDTGLHTCIDVYLLLSWTPLTVWLPNGTNGHARRLKPIGLHVRVLLLHIWVVCSLANPLEN